MKKYGWFVLLPYLNGRKNLNIELWKALSPLWLLLFKRLKHVHIVMLKTLGKKSTLFMSILTRRLATCHILDSHAPKFVYLQKFLSSKTAVTWSARCCFSTLHERGKYHSGKLWWHSPLSGGRPFSFESCILYW